MGSPVSKLSRSSVTPAFCGSSNCLASGKSRRMGMENNAHHNPEPPKANRRTSVDPPACCTGSTVTVAARRQQCARQQCQARKRVPSRAKASLYRHGPRRVRIRQGEAREPYWEEENWRSQVRQTRIYCTRFQYAELKSVWKTIEVGSKNAPLSAIPPIEITVSTYNVTETVCKGYPSISDLLFRRGQNMDKLAV